MPCSGVTTRSGRTVALPPPWVRANFALCPMTATRRRLDGVQGNSALPLAFSLRTSTVPAASAARTKATPSSTTTGSGATASKPVERADPGGQGQNALHLPVDRRLVDLAGADRGDQCVAPRALGPWHDQIL